MGKNFDVERQKRLERDRSFTINGHEFTHRAAVAPESVARWSAMVGGEFVERGQDDKPLIGEPTPARDRDGHLVIRGGRLVPLEGGKEGEMVLQGGEVVMTPGQPISSLTETVAIEILEETIVAFLEPGQTEQWQSARDPEAENPINLADLRALVEWLFEETSGRPTGPSSASSASTRGSASDGPAISSTVASPSPEPVAA